MTRYRESNCPCTAKNVNVVRRTWYIFVNEDRTDKQFATPSVMIHDLLSGNCDSMADHPPPFYYGPPGPRPGQAPPLYPYPQPTQPVGHVDSRMAYPPPVAAPPGPSAAPFTGYPTPYQQNMAYPPQIGAGVHVPAGQPFHGGPGGVMGHDKVSGCLVLHGN